MSAGAAIRPEKLLRELDELWVRLGNEQDSAVLRACSMTLLVITEGADDEVGETIGRLMRGHPSRAIVLRIMPGDAPQLEAAVRAQCWMPFGSRQQICCELIEINMGAASLPDVAPLANSLTAPDLPVAIWLRSPRCLESPGYEPLLRLANKLIVDSSCANDLRAQVSYIRAHEDQDTAVADLAWTRLTRWRAAIAQFFDEPANADHIASIDRVQLEYQGERIPMSAYYVVGWLWRVLGRRMAYEFVNVPGEPARPRLQQIALHAGDWTVSVTVDQDRGVRLNAGSREAAAIFPQLTEFELLNEELSILGRDPVFQDAVHAAAELIG